MFDRLSEITLALAKKGGGGGGSTNYNDLDHKPKINNVELAGSLSLSDLDIQEELTAGTGINITGNTISVDADSAPTKNSQKPVTSGGTKSAIDASQNASLQILKDTVGWTGKNKFGYYIGKAWDVSGNLVTALGAASTAKIPVNPGDRFYSCKNASFGTNKNMMIREYDANGDFVQSEGAVTATGRTKVNTIPNGIYYIAVTLYFDNSPVTQVMIDTYEVMFMDDSISDKSYEPYHQSVENVLQDAEVTPNKNLISFPYNREDGYTTNGVIFTLDSEHKVIANRTSSSTGNSMFRLTYIANPTNAEIDYYAGKILNGCPSGGSDTTYSIVLNAVVSGSTLVVCRDIGDGVTIPSDLSSYYGAEAIYIGVLINKSYSPSNLVFAPMLRDASESDPTYKPYYIPLKDVVPTKANNSALAPVENVSTASQAYAQGEYFTHNGSFCKAKTAITSGATLVEDSNYEVTTIGAELLLALQS